MKKHEEKITMKKPILNINSKSKEKENKIMKMERSKGKENKIINNKSKDKDNKVILINGKIKENKIINLNKNKDNNKVIILNKAKVKDNKINTSSKSQPKEKESKSLRINTEVVRNKRGVYHYPTTDELEEPSKQNNQENEASAIIKGDRLIEVLNTFGIEAELTKTHIGPTVTKFEIKPDSSVKVDIANFSSPHSFPK